MFSKDKLTVFSAYTQLKIAEYPTSSIDDINKALSNARKIADSAESVLSLAQRKSILQKTAQFMAEQIEELANIALTEGGKPLTDSIIEVQRAIEGVELASQAIHHISGSSVPMELNKASEQKIAHSLREPIGVVVAVSAFNHPLNLIVHQVATAIAAGCPVIVKPAAYTPMSCMKFNELLIQAGLPKEWCKVILCDNDLTEQLVTDPRVDFLTFIGSAKVGWHLRSKISPGTRCVLEHGGVAPAIVEPDANFNIAIPSLTKGSFYHAGQVCVSVQRIYVHSSILDPFITKFKKQVSELKVGDPSLKETQVGPLIHPDEVTRVDQWVSEAIEEGAEVICGAQKLSETTYAPTLLLNPSKESKVSQQEVFGPIACIYSYESIDDAVRYSNNLNMAFQSCVYTENISSAYRIAKALNSSAVMVNEHSAFRVDWMPFSGRKHSGLGLGGIEQTIDQMTQEKVIIVNT